MKSVLVRVGNATRQVVGFGRRVVGTGLVVAAASPMAFADTTFDTTTVVAAITAAAAAIALLGAAVVAGPKIAVKAWRWISGAL